MDVVQRRIGVIFAVFFLLLVLAAGRTLYLGVLHSAALRDAARSQQLTEETVPAQRGAITDRNGIDLAVSEPAQDISATPYLLDRPARRGPTAGSAVGAVPGCRAEEAVGAHRLRISRPCRSRRAGAGDPRPEDPGGRGRAGHAPGLPARHAGGTGAGRRWAPKAMVSAGSSTRATRSCTAARENGGWSAMRSDSRCRSPKSTARCPGASLSLTLDANIQQRTEEVLSAVGRVFYPERRHRDRDGPAQRSDPGDGQLARGERQRPGNLTGRGHGEPGGRLRL